MTITYTNDKLKFHKKKHLYKSFIFPLKAGIAKRVIPLLDRILVQRAEALTKTKGGIVIPEKAQSKVLRGFVVAVGPGMRNTVSFNIPN